MAESREPKGLCGTCEHDPGCTFPRAAGRGVVFCEEYADAPPGGGAAEVPGVSASVRGAPDARLGLCGNCDDETTCTFPRAREGVVHCEEHR